MSNFRQIVKIALCFAAALLLFGCASSNKYPLAKNYMGRSLIHNSPLSQHAKKHPVGVAADNAFGLVTTFEHNQPRALIAALRDEGVQIVILGDKATLYVPVDRVFHVSTAEIKPSSYLILDNVVRVAEFYSNFPIIIEGNTDNVPFRKLAYKIGKNQARSIAAFMWAEGINQHRLDIRTNGGDKPIATNHTLFGSHENRNITITIDGLAA